jgi:hypothetical protein
MQLEADAADATVGATEHRPDRGEDRRLILRQPLADARRPQKRLARSHAKKFCGMPGIVISPPHRPLVQQRPRKGAVHEASRRCREALLGCMEEVAQRSRVA